MILQREKSYELKEEEYKKEANNYIMTIGNLEEQLNSLDIKYK